MSLLHYFGQRRGRLALVIAIIVVNAGLLTLGGIRQCHRADRDREAPSRALLCLGRRHHRR